jgi:hypothetical protein
MIAGPKVWMSMSFGGDASWEGNAGYLDDIPTRYQFNSFVPNSRRVQLGDILIIRDRDNVLGFGRVLRLEMELGTTRFRRCPTCSTTKFNARMTKQPAYRCRNGHEFAQPTAETASCTWFTIHYADSSVPAIPPVSVGLFEDAYTSQGSQLSLRPVNFRQARSIALEISAGSARVFADS